MHPMSKVQEMHEMCKSDIGPSADTKHKLLNRETDGLGGGAGAEGEYALSKWKIQNKSIYFEL